MDRLTGFTEGLADRGVEVAPGQIVAGAFTRDDGYAAATELLDRGLRATCVFTLADVVAVGALAAFRDRGLSVPADVSLAGFDGLPIVRDLPPPPTTVVLPLADLGTRAAERVLRPRTRVERVPGTIVLRAGTAALTW